MIAIKIKIAVLLIESLLRLVDQALKSPLDERHAVLPSIVVSQK